MSVGRQNAHWTTSPAASSYHNQKHQGSEDREHEAKRDLRGDHVAGRPFRHLEGVCRLRGEDDTMLVKEQDDIEVENRNPLYTRRLSELWQR